MVTPVNEDQYRIVIMDSTKDVAAVESFARYSLRFGIGCILVYVLILYALCNLIIQPFVHNLENQKRFITNAGHELKTPIAIISANTEVLEMTQGKNEWTANILAQVRRVTRLINDLITMAKLGEAKKEDIQKTEMDLVPWFKETVEQFRPLVKDGEKTLSLEAPETLVASTDKTILTELLNILMDNAIKYCDPQGVRSRLLSYRKERKDSPFPFPTTTPAAKEKTIRTTSSASTGATSPTTVPFPATASACLLPGKWRTCSTDKLPFPTRTKSSAFPCISIEHKKA
jgi:two-component system, OmpR family, sensor histidine kinase CiaH